ncbi:metallophosphoesterase [Halorussus salilacus]|uniref:metallophosphoesterase n=1 Tax=Halorussus salilacus TaxID=2953750 RepID=UPI0020A1937E|nr:metallophosphoesterase [Halorussus salilacus]USZ69047.1 metallophosphoesterase [Halorussus salilacus]
MDAQFRDRAVYLPGDDALVVADLHVGRDAASAVELPLGERADLTDRLADLLARFSPAEVVFAGDLLHAFGRVPEGVEATVERLRSTVADAGAELVAVRGNHDGMLDAVGVSARDSYRVGDTVVHHGHERPAAGESSPAAGRYVVGHDHPAIEIEGTRRPCLLYGPGAFRGADVLMLPAFNRLAPGTVVNGMRTRDFMSPVVTDADALRPVVWDDEAEESLSFPPLGELRRLL